MRGERPRSCEESSAALPDARHPTSGTTREMHRGIVKLSGIAMIDPQHTGFATGLEPIILGVGQPDSA